MLVANIFKPMFMDIKTRHRPNIYRLRQNSDKKNIHMAVAATKVAAHYSKREGGNLDCVMKRPFVSLTASPKYCFGQTTAGSGWFTFSQH